MSTVKELVRDNLVRLRKEKGLTQLELSMRINYSDKAISRWETGEVTPDVETLASLAALYDVPISVFFLPPDGTLTKAERRAEKDAVKRARRARKEREKEEKKQRRENPDREAEEPLLSRRIAYLIIELCFLWTAVLCLFFVTNSLSVGGAWCVFVWGVPLSTMILLAFFHTSEHKRVFHIIFGSLFLWSLLAAIYLQIARWTLFPIFFLGLPAQALILLLPALRRGKAKK